MGIDGRAFRSPAPGIRRYTRSLVRAIVELGEPLELVALGGSPESVPDGVSHVPEPRHPPTNVGWTLMGFPRAARHAGVHVIHAPAYTAPWTAAVPVVLTIHDVSYERHPEWYPYRRDWVRRAFYRRCATSATHVLTVSAFSAAEIAAAYGISRERISVTPLGVDSTFDSTRPPARDAVTAVSGPYVLHVGDLHARRNLAVVLDAVMALNRQQERGRPPLSLVLVGTDRGVRNQLQDAAVRAGTPAVLVHLDHVSDQTLASLYRDAVAFVYPSLYEGFGLPLVEAMASGTPVIAARAASIPEVTGDAAILLDPRDPVGWTRALATLMSEPETRKRLRDAGVSRAREFTWARTARLTVEAYRRVA